MDDFEGNRITRILTNDFPQYFAIITRIRQEVHAIGPEGGILSSTVVPQVQAIFPEGALTKKIKVGLQVGVVNDDADVDGCDGGGKQNKTNKSGFFRSLVMNVFRRKSRKIESVSSTASMAPSNIIASLDLADKLVNQTTSHGNGKLPSTDQVVDDHGGRHQQQQDSLTPTWVVPLLSWFMPRINNLTLI